MVKNVIMLGSTIVAFITMIKDFKFVALAFVVATFCWSLSLLLTDYKSTLELSGAVFFTIGCVLSLCEIYEHYVGYTAIKNKLNTYFKFSDLEISITDLQKQVNNLDRRISATIATMPDAQQKKYQNTSGLFLEDAKKL